MSAQHVLFLAPSVTLGSGGVADYCQQLSAVLADEGFECHLASWKETAEELGPPLGHAVKMLGLHEAGSDVRDKCEKLRAYLQRHEIDLVSLQFVNFGFARRGLIGGLRKALAAAIGHRPCHVFLHELWLGAHRGARLRDQALGRVQKQQILNLLEELKPRAIWTNIQYYQRQLARLGVRSEVLPIFGNIPISSERADDWLLQQCEETPVARAREAYLLVGLFGTIYPDWPFRSVVPRLLKWAGLKRVVFVLFGRSGDSGSFRGYIHSLSNAELLNLGALDFEIVDRVMNSMDVALASTPAEGIFKSGSAVAFLERGIPTVAVHGKLESDAPEPAAHPAVVLLDDHLERKLDAARAWERIPHPLLPMVAERYRELFAVGCQQRHRSLNFASS